MTDLKLGILLWTQAATWHEMSTRQAGRGAGLRPPLDVGPPATRSSVSRSSRCSRAGRSLAAWAMATEQVRLGLLVAPTRSATRGWWPRWRRRSTTSAAAARSSGIGGAWFELEHRAYGIDFGSGLRRAARLAGRGRRRRARPCSMAGRSPRSRAATTSSTELRQKPLPIQPHLPIMIGGCGEREDAPDGREVRRHVEQDGPAGQVRHKMEVLQRHCDDVGRDVSRDRVHARRASSRSATRERRGRPGLECEHGAQPDAHGRRRGRRHVLDRDARADRRAALGLHRARVRHRDLRACRRRTTTRRSSADRRGQAARRSGLAIDQGTALHGGRGFAPPRSPVTGRSTTGAASPACWSCSSSSAVAYMSMRRPGTRRPRTGFPVCA